MNDNDLITAVRQSVSGVRMSVPAENIISRSRAIRARRRIPAAAAALAAAAGTAVAVTTLAAPGHQPAAQLAAWTVVTTPGGAVHVTIRELRDPAGLQQRLRADGVPASVTYYRHPNPSCRPYPIPAHRYDRVFPLPELIPRKRVPVSAAGQAIPGTKPQPAGLILIRTKALPPGAGVQLAATVRLGHIISGNPGSSTPSPAAPADNTTHPPGRALPARPGGIS